MVEFRNFKFITQNILNYLPSRVLIFLNSVLIIPLFTNCLSPKEMSVYLIAIQILNLICTCSFDSISKALLRFYHKYKKLNRINSLYSNIISCSIISYFIIAIIYLISKRFLSYNFSIDNISLLLIPFLIIPVAIRQLLYQLLRLYNKVKLYTISIVLYQILIVTVFLLFFKNFPNSKLIIVTMIIAISIIDILILKKLALTIPIKIRFDKEILVDILKYSIPLIFTNICYWFIFHISKFIFQYNYEFENTAIIGVAWIVVSCILQPIVSVFLFSMFPILIKNFELNNSLTNKLTNLIQLYIIVLLPLIGMFCFMPLELTSIILPQSYSKVYLLFPLFALSVSLHEILKLINLKYHLKNKIYIEFMISLTSILLAIFLNYSLISRYSVVGAGIAILTIEIFMLIINLFIRFNDLLYIKPRKVLKTLFLTSIISIIVYLLLPSMSFSKFAMIFRICLYLFICYVLLYKFKKKIL